MQLSEEQHLLLVEQRTVHAEFRHLLIYCVAKSEHEDGVEFRDDITLDGMVWGNFY